MITDEPCGQDHKSDITNIPVLYDIFLYVDKFIYDGKMNIW
jgi:hypothetical protein